MGKLTLLAGGAVGYVLGTRAGRERFEQIKSKAQTLWEHPKVQQQAGKVQGVAKRKTAEVQDKVSSSTTSSTTPTPAPASTPTPSTYPTTSTSGLA